jgi:HEPN domain-containing protein
MKKQVEAWNYYACKHMLVVAEIINNPDLTNGVAFHCQQAIEQYLKAFLIAYDIEVIRTYDLVLLYDLVKQIRDFGFDLDLLDTLTKLYKDSRYPNENIGILSYGVPTTEQARMFYAFAKDVEQKIKAALQDGE